jgi:ATP-dependent DNA helicase RecG
MALPININELVNGKIVEWERIEFKEGWNPEKVLHTMCGFANDLNNWGGGYIIIGIKEKNGKPALPPLGLKQNQMDAMQKKLLELCHLLTPHYFPVAVPEVFQKKHILILWCPGGETRPYKAPLHLGEKKSPQVYFVRRFSSTVKANHAEELQLMQLAAKVPFDDRINHNAKIEDLKLPLIRSFLSEIKSELYNTVDTLPLRELCQQMQIARGPKEYFKPLNVGLLLFNENPDKFFRGAKIEVVEYADEEGDKFTEKIFTGPIHMQLRDALQYIKNIVIKEQVKKISGRAEADRYFNYPYQAIEEALANAVYHRGYDDQSTIEVNARPDCIEILSLPGPVPSVGKKELKKTRVVARSYRNRRIGDFLKELHLTEGRSTGIPKIRRAMIRNGSPPPIFETDRDKNYFLTTLPVHSEFTKAQKENGQVGTSGAQVEHKWSTSEAQVKILLKYCIIPRKKSDILKKLKLSLRHQNFQKHVQPVIQDGLLVMTIPDKPNSNQQKYFTTENGKEFLK